MFTLWDLNFSVRAQRHYMSIINQWMLASKWCNLIIRCFQIMWMVNGQWMVLVLCITHRPVLQCGSARGGDRQLAYRRIAQIHSAGGQCVWVRAWRLATHTSAATRGCSWTYTGADQRDTQVLLWVHTFLFYYLLLSVQQSNHLKTWEWYIYIYIVLWK